MSSRTKIVSTALFIFALAIGGILLHMNAELASAAPARSAIHTAVNQTTTSPAQQPSTPETEQQSILPPLIIAAIALTLTLTNFYRRRSKDNDT